MAADDPHTATVLIVEDEWLIAEMIACTLADAGYRIAGPAGSVGEARKLVDAGGVDVAVLDVNLGPELSLDFADELAQAGTPVMLTTGYHANDLPPRFRGLPRLSKPVSPRMLVEAVRHLVPG